MQTTAFIPGLETLDNLPYVRLMDIFIACRKLCVSAGRFTSNEHFNDFTGRFVTGEYGSQAAEYVQAGIGQVCHALAINVSIPPSEETLNHGGFLGGHIAWDYTKANEKIREFMAM